MTSDFSVACSYTYTKAQQEASCVSLQESVWGKTQLMRLEAIKRSADPNHRFSCFRCVGNDWAFGPLVDVSPGTPPFA